MIPARLLALAVASCCVAMSAFVATAPALAQVEPVAMTARPIARLTSDGRVRVGSLEFRGGIELTANHPEFGGISGLAVEPNGERFLAVTDRGYWVRGRIVAEGDRPVTLADVVMAPLLSSDGRSLRSRGMADAESLTATPDGYAVGVERKKQWIFGFTGPDPMLSRARGLASGGPLAVLGANQGPEALAWLPAARSGRSGSLVIIAERSQTSETELPGFILPGGSGGSAKLLPFTLVRRPPYDATDLAIAPDGTAYLLERRFGWLTGIGMRIRRFPASEIKAGAVIDPEVIFEAGNSAQIDNMEALGVHLNAAGETILTVMSDDNFSKLQRTILLRFAVLPPAD